MHPPIATHPDSLLLRWKCINSSADPASAINVCREFLHSVSATFNTPLHVVPCPHSLGYVASILDRLIVEFLVYVTNTPSQSIRKSVGALREIVSRDTAASNPSCYVPYSTHTPWAVLCPHWLGWLLSFLVHITNTPSGNNRNYVGALCDIVSPDTAGSNPCYVSYATHTP